MPPLTADRMVLAVGLLGGLLLTFVTPPFQAPDEPDHFFHIYQIAAGAEAERGPDGALGFQLPASLGQLADLCLGQVPFHPERRLPSGVLAAAWRLPLAPQRTAFLPIGRLSPYTPGAYLAAVPGVAVGRLLRLPPLALLYLARLGNLAASLALVWTAVRLAPVYRWLFALLALTPMAMFTRSTASADGPTNALALLLVSCVLALALADASAPPPTPEPAAARGAPSFGRHLVFLLAAAVLLAAAKAVYFLFDLLIFMVVPARLGATRRGVALWAGGLAAMAAGAGTSWWVARIFFTARWLRPGVQPTAQLRRVLDAPLHFLALAVTDYSLHLPRYAAGFVGNFGWLDAPLPRLATLLWALLLIAVALTDGEPAITFAGWQRAIVAIVVGATLVALSVSQYVAWTPVGASFIEGLQGRYFLPVAPAGALLLYNRRLAGRWPVGPGAGWRLGGISQTFVILTLGTLWFRYYAGPCP